LIFYISILKFDFIRNPANKLAEPKEKSVFQEYEEVVSFLDRDICQEKIFNLILIFSIGNPT